MTRASRRITAYHWGLLIAILTVWELAVVTGAANAFWVSSPRLIAARLWEQLLDGELLFHTGVTMKEALAGMAAGSLCGAILGLILGTTRTLGLVMEPFIIAVNSLPRVALGPLLVMYVGIGFASKFLLAFSLVVVPVMLNTYEGVRSVDPTLVDLMRTLGARRWQMFYKLLLPNCIPWIFSALRVAIAFAIIGAIVGEFISSRAGIGYMIDTASGSFDTTGILVPLLVLMLLAFGMDRLIVVAGKHLLRWRKAEVP